MVKLRKYKKFSNNQMNGGAFVPVVSFRKNKEKIGEINTTSGSNDRRGISIDQLRTARAYIKTKVTDPFFKKSHYIAILICIVGIIWTAIWSAKSGVKKQPNYYGKWFNVENPYGYRIEPEEADSRIGIITTGNNYTCGGGTNGLNTKANRCIDNTIVSNPPLRDCCPGNDKGNGNCNVLYDILTREKGDCRGMKGVEKILDSGVSNDTKTENKYLKNQIKYLLCQQAKQNVFSYDPISAGGTAVLTWDGIVRLNGWDDSLTISNGRFVFYMTCIIALWCPFVGLLWKITSNMININRHSVFTTLVEYSFYGDIRNGNLKPSANVIIYILAQINYKLMFWPSLYI